MAKITFKTADIKFRLTLLAGNELNPFLHL